LAWHKKKSRMEEIKTLLQGKTLHGNLSTTKFTPPTTVCSTLHSAATMVFTDPEDRTGQKRVNPPKATDPIPSTTELVPIDTTMDLLVDEAAVKRKPSIKVLKQKPTQPTVYMQSPAKPTTVILPYGQTLPSTSSAVALPKTTFYRQKKNNSEPSTKRRSIRAENVHSQWNHHTVSSMATDTVQTNQEHSHFTNGYKSREMPKLPRMPKSYSKDDIFHALG